MVGLPGRRWIWLPSIPASVGEALEALRLVIVSDEAEEADLAPQGGEVARDVRGAAQRIVFTSPAKDLDGGLGRDALHLSPYIAIENEIAHDEDCGILADEPGKGVVHVV